jgi:2-polyprenyl-3-methyl-5-hydroxy-6-metoxy-1,4-benzoquinol methylase
MTSAPDFEPWNLKWEPSHIKRFWDWWGSNPALENRYFSKNNGASIVDHLQAHVGLAGTVIDLGAGPGFLVDLLLQHGAQTLAIDQSPASIELLKRRYQHHTNFIGARTSTTGAVPASDGEGDIVLLIETVEHLDDSTLNGVLREARRILKLAGHIFVTTPNEENLDSLKIMCPSCGCLFHTYQHVRSWSAGSLAQKMNEHGFQTVVCHPTLFSFAPKPARWLHRLAYFAMKRRLPHLLYVGRAI